MPTINHRGPASSSVLQQQNMAQDCSLQLPTCQPNQCDAHVKTTKAHEAHTETKRSTGTRSQRRSEGEPQEVRKEVARIEDWNWLSLTESNLKDWS